MNRSKQTRSVLFVCMGNICRSPAAEGVYKRYDVRTIFGRRVEAVDFENFDLIVAMDDDNYRDLSGMDTGQGARVVRMCDYGGRHGHTEVPDPYYGGPQGFETVLDILEDACADLLEELRPGP